MNYIHSLTKRARETTNEKEEKKKGEIKTRALEQETSRDNSTNKNKTNNEKQNQTAQHNKSEEGEEESNQQRTSDDDERVFSHKRTGVSEPGRGWGPASLDLGPLELAPRLRELVDLAKSKHD